MYNFVNLSVIYDGSSKFGFSNELFSHCEENESIFFFFWLFTKNFSDWPKINLFAITWGLIQFLTLMNNVFTITNSSFDEFVWHKNYFMAAGRL